MGERRPATALDAQALSVLSKGAPVLLLSAGRDGQPHSTYSWAVAQDGACLRVGVDCGGRTSANWQHSRRAAVQLLGQGGLNLLIDGRATRLASALACTAEMEPWELAVESVLDQSWPGVATSALRYRWPAGQALPMRRFERTLFRELLGLPAPRRR